MQIEMMSTDRLVPCIRNTRNHRRGCTLRARSADPLEHQFGQDNFPFVAAEEVLEIFCAVLPAPFEDGRDLAAQKGRAERWRLRVG